MSEAPKLDSDGLEAAWRGYQLGMAHSHAECLESAISAYLTATVRAALTVGTEAKTADDLEGLRIGNCDIDGASGEDDHVETLGATPPAEPSEQKADARLYDANAPMADGEIQMTAAEDVLAWLLIEKIGVPDDMNYSPKDAQETIAKTIDHLREYERAALNPSEQKAVAWREFDHTTIDYVLQYGGRCRECADHTGLCPNGLPCDVDDAKTAIRWVLRSLNYGISNGYIASPPPSGDRGSVKVKALEWAGPDSSDEYYSIGNIDMQYVIRAKVAHGFWLVDIGGYFTTLEAAKAAAQADYGQRILSAITTDESDHG